MNRTGFTCTLVIGIATFTAMSTGANAADYHHVHVTASNATEAVKWYTEYMECLPLSDRDDAVDCAGTEIVFVSRPTLGSSQRTGIDHIAFSYADLTIKMSTLEAVGVRGSGVRLQRFEDGATLRVAPGLFKHGFIFDPWGTRIELVEDKDLLGFHHIHLSSTDPQTTLSWYHEIFGGERARLRNRLDGILLNNIWLFATHHAEGTPAATTGRAIDHIAFSVEDLDTAAVEMRRKNVRFVEEPRVPKGARTPVKRAFVAGPDNVRLEIVESGFAGVAMERTGPVDITTKLTDYTVARTPWGTPDFQGIWTGDAAHGIPLERPQNDGGREVLTAEEAAARRERGTLNSIWGYEAEWRDTTLGYVKSAPSQQVAMVTDPPNGRLPSTTPAGQERLQAARASYRQDLIPAGPEDLSNWVRCITRGVVPMPAIYNNGLQIVQGPDQVAIQWEMIHETRVIPTSDGSHMGPGITSYLGDARGRWEGDTLVVEVTNFNDRASFRGSSENLTLTERWTRTGPETLRYEFTFDDPTVWEKPWTGTYTFVRDDSQYELVEYACHEGNNSMFNILTGGRAKETAGK